MAKDYYQILGLDRKASKDDIKKAFHKLAHRYHPDKKGGDTEKFKEISEAYSILSDDRKRAEYDSYGRVFNENGAGSPFGRGASGFDFSAAGNAFEDIGINFGDIFGDFFGTNGTSRERARGRDISLHIEIPFKEAIFGTMRKVVLEKSILCNTCGGNAAKPGTEMKTCSTCQGNGRIRDSKRSLFGAINIVRACETCKGSGKIPKERCSTCHGNGILRKNEEITVNIPAGIQDGEVIRLSGMADAVSQGTAGDLYIQVKVGKHENLEREGSSLVMNLNIKLSEAILGTEHRIETLDGSLTVKIPEGIQFGEVLRIKGKGVPQGRGRRGDLLLRLHIILPKRLSRKARTAVEELKKEGV